MDQTDYLRSRRTLRSIAVSAVLSAVAFSGCTQSEPEDTWTTYTTEYGLGPDKWATAWLLTRHADPGARLVVIDPGAPPAAGVAFDMPTSAIRRTPNRSAFEVAYAKFGLSDPVVLELSRIVHEIEVNFWAAGGPPESDSVEQAYRALQYREGRDAVDPACYLAFFDRVYEVLRDAKLKSIPLSRERLHMDCEELIFIAEKGRDFVPEVPIVDVLSAAAAGRKVVFVDVREVDEFVEGHIPGALNITLREVSPRLRERLSHADYVVSYCVKDFRGFEMAKALANVGVANSVIMRPYGIKGWVALGLPITGTKALDEQSARQALDRCLENPGRCAADASTPI